VLLESLMSTVLISHLYLSPCRQCSTKRLTSRPPAVASPRASAPDHEPAGFSAIAKLNTVRASSSERQIASVPHHERGAHGQQPQVYGLEIAAAVGLIHLRAAKRE
jgi:hypothetical protein